MRTTLTTLLALAVVALTTIHSQAALWTPAEIDTVGWYDASDAGTITDTGGTVTQWDDKSGNDLHLTASGDPQTGSRTINSLNVIDFDGSGDWLNRSAFPIPTSHDVSLFVVTVQDNTAGYMNAAGFFKSNYTDHLIIGKVDQKTWEISNFDFPLGSRHTGTKFGEAWTGETKMFNMVVDNTAGEWSGYADGTNYGTLTPAGSLGSSYDFALGYFNTNNQLDGALAEVIVLEDTSPVTRQTIEGYLAWKWGLQDNLPSDHLYKSAAPTVAAAAVPEPSSLALFGLGLIGLICFGRRRKR